MELNTEINRIFGEEMAKIFSNTISDEELMKKAQSVWNDLNLATDSWGSRKQPEIVRYIKEEILKRLYEKIEIILKEPIAEEALEKKAREMVEEARKIGEEAIIKDMARHMTNNALSVYGRTDEIVDQIMYKLRTENSKY